MMRVATGDARFWSPKIRENVVRVVIAVLLGARGLTTVRKKTSLTKWAENRRLYIAQSSRNISDESQSLLQIVFLYVL